jgi:hypothetical protein
LFLALLAVALSAPAQTIDGSKDPDLIPDSAAYRLYLKAVADSGHVDAYLAGHHTLRPDSRDRAKAIILQFKADFDSLVAWYNGLPETLAGTNKRTAEFLTKRDLLVRNTKNPLTRALSIDEMSSFDSYVQNEKRFMKYAPEPVSAAAKPGPRLVNASFHAQGSPQSGGCMSSNYSTYTAYALPPATVFAIQNSSFETAGAWRGSQGTSQWNGGPIPGWNSSGAGSLQAGANFLNQPLPDGTVVAWSGWNLTSPISQTLSATLVPNQNYQLSVYVGRRLDGNYTANLTMLSS